MVECPECGAGFEWRRKVAIGDTFECPECATELQLEDSDPLTVEVAETPPEEEDDASGETDRAEDEDWLT